MKIKIESVQTTCEIGPALLTICRIFILLAVSELTGVRRCRRCCHFIPKPYTLPVGNA